MRGWASLARIGQIMARPELKRWRLATLAALVLTLASKVFAVYAPVFFGDAINLHDGPGRHHGGCAVVDRVVDGCADPVCEPALSA